MGRPATTAEGLLLWQDGHALESRPDLLSAELAHVAARPAAVGAGGPPKCRPTGCSFAQAFLAARNAGNAGLGRAPFEPGSGKLGTPVARMQSAYFTACVPADPELLGVEEEPHAATATAHTASAARRRAPGAIVRCIVRGGA
jgi:hypothetical protein